MKIAFLINDIQTEKDNYTTIRLARRALKDHHQVALVGLSDLIYNTDEKLSARASIPAAYDYADDAALLAELQDDHAETQLCMLSDYDVVLLRADPADELITRPWATSSALLFAQLLVQQGVLVLNDPKELTDASNKTYFQTYPAHVRPKTHISRDVKSIQKAIDEFEGKAVIKPLQGSGGQGVFIVNEDAAANINQIIEATIRDGYAIVQEYLPKAVNGDLRLITLNGRPLQVEGHYGCIRRYNDTGDGRSNISAGGKYEIFEPDEDAIKLAYAVGPKLIRDGMYLAGLDIVGDKMMEINVDTPGGINMMEELTGADFSGYIINDLVHKIELNSFYNNRLSIAELALR